MTPGVAGNPPPTPLALTILQALAECGGAGTLVALPRLGKRLGASASVLLRELALMGDAPVAGQAGLGWVRLSQQDGRWSVALTPQGLALLPCLVLQKS